MKLPNITAQTATFYSLGALTTVGSIVGSFRGLESELGTSLALIGSTGLGVITYASLNVMFNRSGTVKRCAAALLSAACICVSGETILLDVINKSAASQQTQVSSEALEAKASRQQLIEVDKQMKTDLRGQLAALEDANQIDRTDAAKRQADIRTEISEIQRLNLIDVSRITGFQKDVNRGQKPKTNRANIRAARKAIDQRNVKLSTLNAQIETISNALTAKISHRETQASGIHKRLTTQLELPAIPSALSTSSSTQQAASLGTRIRSYLYDLMTVIFMLLTAWYRPEVPKKDSGALADIVDTSSDFTNLLPDSGDILPTQNSDIDHKQPLHRANINQPEKEEENQPEPISKDEIIEQLRRFQITPNIYGRITPEAIATLAGWGKGKAKKFMLEECVSEGVLDDQEDGRGMFFVYPSVVTRQLSLVQGGIS